VTDAELCALFDLLRMPAEEREALGPMSEVLRTRRVAHVIVRDAGRAELADEIVSDHAWDLATLAELGGLTGQIYGQYERTEFREMLRGVTGGQGLNINRVLALLERPRAFAQYMVDLASRIRPRDTIDLNSQLAVLEAISGQLATVFDRLPRPDQLRLFGKLEQATIWLSRAMRRMTSDERPLPFADLVAVAALFPHRLRDLDLKESLTAWCQPGAGLAAVLLSGLRRAAGGDVEMEALFAGAGGHPRVSEQLQRFVTTLKTLLQDLEYAMVNVIDGELFINRLPFKRLSIAYAKSLAAWEGLGLGLVRFSPATTIDDALAFS
jgi:hypothetical protein